MGARSAWWDLRREAVLEPDWEVVDAHFHLWDARRLPDPEDPARLLQTSRYLLDEFLRDARSGHRVVQCVYVECGSAYRADGPANLRPVGETAFAAAAAERAAAAGDGPEIAAIVAHADLRDPDLDAALDAHAAAADGRLCSIRHHGARLENPADRLIAGAAPAGLYADPAFRRGVARLGERGLAFDAFQFHFQFADLEALARAVPGTTLVVNHLNTPFGYTPGPAAADPVFTQWARQVDVLARLPNIVMKLGGLASVVTGYDGCRRDLPPSSRDFVDERGAYFFHAIERLGAERCMFESNFPVDSVAIGYRVLWNAYKLIAGEFDADARTALLAGTARRVYRMPRRPAAVRRH
ncbi:MAG: amidohydrolase family protein [Hyphomicrobiales bacterium]|nr:amidohydrolase family protein [Hyphomicrobiales bacterium]